jgi:hypothetical protein
MKYIKIVALLLLAFLGLSPLVWAQKYRTAVGVRVGKTDFGFTAQQKILERTTLEGIVGMGMREGRGTLLIEQHFPIVGKGFNYYLGAGGHVGTLKEYGNFYGLNAIAGVEMKLPLFPLVASVDVKPAVHVNHENWASVQGAFSVRYILVKEKKKERRIRGIFGRKDEVKKKPGLFGKKEEPPKKKVGLFGKQPEPEPVKKKSSIFGRPKEPEPAPETPKKRFRLFEKEPEPLPPPPPQAEKRKLRLFEKEPLPAPQPEPEPESGPEKRRIRFK